ncbi:peptidoglycan DD-metalloendopeptidase family protein [Paenarthrobacter sp. A20]|uniref:M23 family metallopeptidase n=1 Tax=Paenarthrobacter sp. A20 TaxID=2817891 RepID=UPI0020A0C108|nr:peptidoglycan DD-metalloendopeptidase family protein [Paenarthrobacter sp. A20]MCP1412799.1 murein DD-endopeptidase MepM/ murein hydrolase activator NlpD [Paenarthrobacter sp. A20]
MNTGHSDGHHRVTPLHVPPATRTRHRIPLPLAVLTAATLIGSFPSGAVQTLHPSAEQAQAHTVEPAPAAAGSPAGSRGSANEPAFRASSASTTTPPTFASSDGLGALLCGQTNTGRGALPAGGPVSDVQLRNASAIVAAAEELALPADARILGIQAALGESSLESKDYGDAAGPDSRGLFQQRANGAWGSSADRMDPFVSATSFFLALKDVKDWQALPSSIAIHRVQRNQDPDHYTKYRQLAEEIAGFLGSQSLSAPGTCSFSGGSWGATAGDTSRRPARPGPGTLISPLVNLHPSSPFGQRTNPMTGSAGEFHTGQDYAAACGTPVHSADEGTVREVGWHPWGGGNRVEIDHGSGLVTTYNHLQSVAVRKGETVLAADVVGLVGSTGASTGCHLHFETIVNGTLADPSAWSLVPLAFEAHVNALRLTSFAQQTDTTPAWNVPQWSPTTALGNQETPAAGPATPPPAPASTPPATDPPIPFAPPTTPPSPTAAPTPATTPPASSPTSPPATPGVPTAPPTTEPTTPTTTAPVAPTTPPTTEPTTPTTTAPAPPVTPTAPPTTAPAPVEPVTPPTTPAPVEPVTPPTTPAPAPAPAPAILPIPAPVATATAVPAIP